MQDTNQVSYSYNEYDELSDREQLILNIWDTYKDVYDVRPRHINFNNMSDIELKDMYNQLLDEINYLTSF